MKHLILFFIVSLFSSILLAGTIDPATPDSRYIEYAKNFVYVGKLCGQTEDKKAYCASAVAIKPRWIVTAAHVVAGSKTCTLNINSKKISVSKIITHKDFNEQNFGIYDIAIGWCDDDIGLKFYPELYDKDDEIGKVCSISGFGLHGNFNTGANKSDTQQRAGSNRIDSIDRHLLICSPSVNNKKTALEFLISSGDSGGGLFIGNKLAGINSCVIAEDKKPDSTYGDEAGHTRISMYKKWIIENIEFNKE
jgi:hypothetical protein